MTFLLRAPFGNTGLTRRDDDAITALHREINRAFDDMWSPLSSMAPVQALKLDVKEDEKSFHVTAELPGMSEKEVEVTFDDGMLTIRGEKKIERNEKKDTWHIVERSCGSFMRQLSMPSNIDNEKIEARFDKGVLTITMPKQSSEQAKVKKIEVKAG
ncbi:MAG: Hsp20/alpha crystallin family protein [Alphaproteobacteria bacterium]|nr:Hsp20/alpha crystallin family protein [Alphaproteobacteria bacterium]